MHSSPTLLPTLRQPLPPPAYMHIRCHFLPIQAAGLLHCFFRILYSGAVDINETSHSSSVCLRGKNLLTSNRNKTLSCTTSSHNQGNKHSHGTVLLHGTVRFEDHNAQPRNFHEVPSADLTKVPPEYGLFQEDRSITQSTCSTLERAPPQRT